MTGPDPSLLYDTAQKVLELTQSRSSDLSYHLDIVSTHLISQNGMKFVTNK